MVHDKVGI